MKWRVYFQIDEFCWWSVFKWKPKSMLNAADTNCLWWMEINCLWFCMTIEKRYR